MVPSRQFDAPNYGDERKTMSSARGMLNCGDWAQGQGERSIGLYVVSIPLAFVSPWISVTLYIAGALIWFVPDRRIESTART